jgi:hypothetical protein
MQVCLLYLTDKARRQRLTHHVRSDAGRDLAMNDWVFRKVDEEQMFFDLK